MDRIAQAFREDRAELFRGAAAILQPKRSPAIIEKDFWVCWTLRRIYEVLQFRPQLIFKGGTSLSKVFDAIERFSEDVDLSLRPYAAEAVPQAFTVAASCRVHALDARRTFWEKATLLHAYFHRPADKPLADGQLRHYYDLCRLSQQDIGRQALERVELLKRVVAHKRLFFASARARYETATAGSFHLIPPEERIPPLRADYARMREMIYGDVPSWKEIMEVLHNVENRINKV